MGTESGQATGEPVAKRQRTDDVSATRRAGGQAPVGGAPQGQNHKQNGQDGGGGGRKRKGGQKDSRIPMMQQAVKRNNLQFAMKVFREAVAEGANVPTGVVNSLMYLACGGEQWERYARGLSPLSHEEMAAAAAAAAAGAAGGESGDGGEEAGAGDAAEAQQQQQKAQQQQRGKQGKVLVPEPEGPPPPKEVLIAAVDELWAYMGGAGLGADQGTYLALARREALKGDPEAALQWARECFAKGKPMQLRIFHPAQVGYCLAGDVASLHTIDGLIAAHRLDATEYEYARLLEGIAAAGSYEQLRAVLVRMQSDLNQLSPATAAHVTAFFARQPEAATPEASEAADAAAAASSSGSGAWRWHVLPGVEVEAGGRCGAAGGSLRVIDLADAEWESFATAIAELARKNMGSRSGDFDAYAEWYDRNGPYDVLVDAANVAFFGQNHEGGGFCWDQIQAMYDMLRRRFADKKILVMLHRRRLNDPEARSPSVTAFLERLKRTKSFYYTPAGANDDWFWLYACVRSKHAGLLVSNDLLRDHIFSLLRPKHFLKWKERHIARYDFAPGSGPASLPPRPAEGEGAGAAGAADAATSGGGRGGRSVRFELSMPRPYTACVQQLGESGAWMLPLSDGSWTCIRPEREG